MSKKHDGDEMRFSRLGEAWYAATALRDGVNEEVCIGFYCPDGGTTGEFSVEWKTLGGKSVPELRCFSDGWSALANIPGLLAMLEQMDEADPTPDAFCLGLLALGLTDGTPRTPPKGYAKPVKCPTCGAVRS